MIAAIPTLRHRGNLPISVQHVHSLALTCLLIGKMIPIGEWFFMSRITSNRPIVSWVYRRFYVADGNFKADHVRQKNTVETWLSEGGGMMANRDAYQSFLRTATERLTVSDAATNNLISDAGALSRWFFRKRHAKTIFVPSNRPC